MADLLIRPFFRLHQFASSLGWNGLQQFSCLDWQDNATRIYLYQTPDDKFNLQINEEPFGQVKTYCATIKASRYGISRIAWVPFVLFDDHSEFDNEVSRVFPHLARKLWKSKTWRRQRLMQPGIVPLPSKKKRRGLRAT